MLGPRSRPTNVGASRKERTEREEKEERRFAATHPANADRLTFIAAVEQCGIIGRIGVAIVIAIVNIDDPRIYIPDTGHSPVIRSANGALQGCTDSAWKRN